MTKGLRGEQDAYGQLLLAFFEGRAGQEIMERDDGFIYCGSPSDYFAPYRRWPSREKTAMRYVRGRVLDVGCGAGESLFTCRSAGTRSSRSTTRRSPSRWRGVVA